MRFVKIYEDLEDWQWYHDSKMVHLFLHLILKANFLDGFFMGTLIKRGQIATGRKTLSERLGMSEMSIRNRLEKLVETKEITIKTTNHFSIITICNYEKYQTKQPTKQPTDNQPITNKQPTNNHPVTTIEEVIEGLEVKEGKEINSQAETSSAVSEPLVIEIKKETSKKSLGAEKKVPNPLFVKCKDYYWRWYQNRFKMVPDFDGSDGIALKNIISYFNSQPDNSGDEKVYLTWITMLTNFDKWEKFHQGQTRIRQINSNKSNIINTLKNGKAGTITATGYADALEKRFAEKRSTPTI